MYVFDKNVFLTLGHYYPKRFPSVWKKLNELVGKNKLLSVREVMRELEFHCPFPHVMNWVSNNKAIFKKPSEKELRIVAEIFKKPQFLGFVKKQNFLKGLPVADPFIVASAKVNRAIVVTQEKFVKGGAKIPTACKEFGIDYINLEEFLEKENLEF